MTDSDTIPMDKDRAYEIYYKAKDSYKIWLRDRSLAYQNTFTSVYDAVYDALHTAYLGYGLENNDECTVANNIASIAAKRIWDDETDGVNIAYDRYVKAKAVYFDLNCYIED